MTLSKGVTMSRFCYGVKLTPESDGGWIVTVRDIPEAITQGDNVESALIEASDCLEEAIAARIDDQRDIPIPSPLTEDEYKVYLPIQTALKASVYLAMKESSLSKVQLASLLNVDEKEVRRILDPHHRTKLPTIERTLQALGQQISLTITSTRP
ncbi:type II toxin-antitoxin system HicB family antitoxin [Cyanothece sp. BG0011]|uniref:type II toxin-antitoxin system HicB family antitoxin n=1 Tax=Cyanothece sp. BG0011 TaxID=2082950 RepID=UPI000D1F0363|nr:type II toxin-antitoxin system HicB family antitoxin [Cyanothece sp. BG0011]